MIEIKIIDSTHKQDINLPNEPFQLWGRMIPSYENETWHYTVTEYAPQDISEMCFPDEDYDYDGLFEDHVFVGAYDGDKCIGVAILVDDWFKYMYLDDLKVCKSYRKQGVGKALLDKALEIANARNYNGLYTIGQDNNLNACMFYLKMGFTIGGFDNHIYRGTAQENKANIIFYLDR
jgi:GNAT superfamily N-acetyltransferase